MFDEINREMRILMRMRRRNTVSITTTASTLMNEVQRDVFASEEGFMPQYYISLYYY